MLRQPLLFVVATALLALAPLVAAQQNGFQQNAFVGGVNLQGQNNGGFQGGNGNQQGNGQGQGNGFRGGAANADFESLMDLITSTVAPDTWLDNGGAAADIRPFPGGRLDRSRRRSSHVDQAAPSRSTNFARIAPG